MMSFAGEVVRALFSRKWWWVTLIVVGLMILLARLGFWQLDRLEQRRAANAQLLAAIESNPIDLNADAADYVPLRADEVSTDLANRDVVATGEFDYANQRVLKLQNLSGRAGVHLITPLVLDGADAAILVDRGWIPDAEHQAGNAFDEATGTQTVDGYVAMTETLMRSAADSAAPAGPGLELFRVDIDAIEAELPYKLLPFYLKVTPPEGGVSGLPIPMAKEVDLSEGPHLDYALQWFVFCLGLGTAYVIYIIRWLKTKDAPQPSTTQEASV